MNRPNVAAFVRALGRALAWTATLFAETVQYFWRWTADAAGAAQVLLLRRSKRRAPERVVELDAREARLAERRAARWASWRTLPWQRRTEVRAAASLLVVVAVVALRAYWSIQSAKPQQSVLTTSVGRVQQHETIASRERPANAEDASTFWRKVGAAQPGAWITNEATAPALGPGQLGAWDDFKVGSPVVIGETGGGPPGRGTRYRLWYRGCHFLGADYTCGVGHATSNDAVSWDRSPQPVFVPSAPIDQERLDTIAVARGADGYVLWYSVSPAWFKGRRFATLYVATSRDGLAWTAKSDPVYTAVAQARRLAPSALWDGARFHLWAIDSRSAINPETGRFPDMPPDGDDVILHFTSSDGTKLELAGTMPIRPLQMDPAALWVGRTPSGGYRALFYEQHPLGTDPQGVAVLRSIDGTSWTRSKDDAEPLGVRTFGPGVVPLSLTAVEASNGLLTWFVVRRDRGGESLRVAFHRDGA